MTLKFEMDLLVVSLSRIVLSFNAEIVRTIPKTLWNMANFFDQNICVVRKPQDGASMQKLFGQFRKPNMTNFFDQNICVVRKPQDGPFFLFTSGARPVQKYAKPVFLKMLQHGIEYLRAKNGFDTAENGPSKVPYRNLIFSTQHLSDL